MNWIGIDTRGLFLAAFGATGGFVTFGLLAAQGVLAPWVVGACVGALGLVGSRDRSLMRGLLLGTVAVWTAAGAQAHYLGGSLVPGLARFHASLTWSSFALYVLCAAVAVALGAWSFRRDARVAGT